MKKTTLRKASLKKEDAPEKPKAFRRAKNITEDLNKTLADGWCEVNLARLSNEDMHQFTQKVFRHRAPLRGFKLVVSARSNEAQDEVESSLLADKPYLASDKKHQTATQTLTTMLQNDKMRK